MRATKFAGVFAVLAVPFLAVACAAPQIACPAIGYVYSAPVTIQIDPAMVGDGSVAACFGEGCEPALVVSGGAGKWELPQMPPYVLEDSIGLEPGGGIRVVILDSAGIETRDEWFEVPYTTRADGPCPGPVDFQPVVVT